VKQDVAGSTPVSHPYFECVTSCCGFDPHPSGASTKRETLRGTQRALRACDRQRWRTRISHPRKNKDHDTNMVLLLFPALVHPPSSGCADLQGGAPEDPEDAEQKAKALVRPWGADERFVFDQPSLKGGYYSAFCINNGFNPSAPKSARSTRTMGIQSPATPDYINLMISSMIAIARIPSTKNSNSRIPSFRTFWLIIEETALLMFFGILSISFLTSFSNSF
jgi:hypothetical protein